jgi:hypothetical protein
MKRLASVTTAASKATQASQRRDELIRQAHAEGSTIRAIALAAGISPSRVHQIIHGR